MSDIDIVDELVSALRSTRRNCKSCPSSVVADDDIAGANRRFHRHEVLVRMQPDAPNANGPIRLSDERQSNRAWLSTRHDESSLRWALSIRNGRRWRNTR